MHTGLKRPLHIAGGLLLLLALLPITVSAHVKWFSDAEFSDQPQALADIINPAFIGLALLSVVVIASLVFVDRLLNKIDWYRAISDWLAQHKDYSTLALRIGMGATLLLSWQADSLLAPELPVPDAWIGWAQFVLVLLLLFPQTTPIAGAGVLSLYLLAIFQFGAFYMLDYLLFLGVGYFLIVSQSDNPRTRATRLPALYATVGFSLGWLGLEKLIFPQWGLEILNENPALTLGFPPEFFLQAAAFVEISLGVLLIICLLQRPISLVITLVFFTTTLIFGKQEVIGHTIIHAALVVFILEGPGDIYKAPVTFPDKYWQRAAFAGASFLLILGGLLPLYLFGANSVSSSVDEDSSENNAPSATPAPTDESRYQPDMPALVYAGDNRLTHQ